MSTSPQTSAQELSNTPRTDEAMGLHEVGDTDPKRVIALARQLERELAEAKFRPLGDNHHNAWSCPYCRPKISDELAQAQARIAEIERDAARYRWLRNHPGLNEPIAVVVVHADGTNESYSSTRLDAAIDVALKEQQ